MKDKKLFKLLKKNGYVTPKGRIRCNCGRVVKLDKIVYIHPIDTNYFDWWMYEMVDKDKNTIIHNTKFVSKYWYGYIGYVPILNDIVYYLYKWFHKKRYVFIIDCKYCENK